MAADWTMLRRDASTRGGLLTWPVEAPEGPACSEHADHPAVVWDNHLRPRCTRTSLDDFPLHEVTARGDCG